MGRQGSTSPKFAPLADAIGFVRKGEFVCQGSRPDRLLEANATSPQAGAARRSGRLLLSDRVSCPCFDWFEEDGRIDVWHSKRCNQRRPTGRQLLVSQRPDFTFADGTWRCLQFQ